MKYSTAVLLLVLCSGTVLTGLIRAQSERSNATTLPEVIAPLTKEELLSKIPNFYYFDYTSSPAGRRWWLRVDDNTWIERYPDGNEMKFKVLGHITLNNTEGTLVANVSEDPAKAGMHQCFIPDKGSTAMHHWVRLIGIDNEWADLGPMEDVQ